MNKHRDIFSPFGKKKNQNVAENFDYADPWMMVRDWYATDLGQILLKKEKELINQLLDQIFGYNLIQLGCLDNAGGNKGLTDKSRTSYQYVFESLGLIRQANSSTQVISDFEQLSIQNHSVDAVILPHTLEFEKNPHQILREVERILIAEGKAIFLGFNPFSTWGLWHKYWEIKYRRKIKSQQYLNEHNQSAPLVPLPSCGYLISQKRLHDWLQLLGFDIDIVSEYFYRPPIQNSALLNKLEFMEQAGQFSKILPAGGYLMVATKRVSTLTPIKQGWKFSKKILTPETIETAGLKSDISPSTLTKHSKKR